MSSHLVAPDDRDPEESKYENEKDDEEDTRLDEMLEKAERLRLAMLAASALAAPAIQRSKNTVSGDIVDIVEIEGDDDGDGDDDIVDPERTLPPAIPTTIDTADTVTECSSVGYYSIVYGSTNPTNATNLRAPGPQKNSSAVASRQWFRGEPLSIQDVAVPVPVPVVEEEEEEKTNEDGSVHYAFSDDGHGSSRRGRRPNAAPDNNDEDDDKYNDIHIDNDISPKSSQNSTQELSPVAAAPPDDDDDQAELVTVADYLKSNNGDPTKNGDYVTWVKVDFVDQSDDDYVPLQDYSRTRTVLYHRFKNEREEKSSSPKAQFRRRKHLRKMATFGLCCVVLAFVWSRLSLHPAPTNNAHTNTTNNKTTTTKTLAALPHKAIVDPVVRRTGKAAVVANERAPARAIATAGNAATTRRSPSPGLSQESTRTAMVPVNHHHHHRHNNNNIVKQNDNAHSYAPVCKRHVLGSLVQSMLHFGMGDYPYRSVPTRAGGPN